MIEKILTLSTAHMPSESPDFGGLVTVKFDYGYVAWVSHLYRGGEGHGVPGWLIRVMRRALNEDCTLILFDRDAATEPEFPQYDWGNLQ